MDARVKRALSAILLLGIGMPMQTAIPQADVGLNTEKALDYLDRQLLRIETALIRIANGEPPLPDVYFSGQLPSIWEAQLACEALNREFRLKGRAAHLPAEVLTSAASQRHIALLCVELAHQKDMLSSGVTPGEYDIPDLIDQVRQVRTTIHFSHAMRTSHKAWHEH